MKIAPKFPYLPLVCEVYETRSLLDALQKINKDGFVMIGGIAESETDGERLFSLGKIDPKRA